MGNPVFCNRPVPLQGLFGWSQAVFVPCREQRGKKKSLIWIKLSSMLLFVPKFPLLWLLHPRSWALSGRQCRDVLPLFTGIPRWAYTQIVSKVPAGLRSVTVEALHPSERMWYSPIPSLQRTDIVIITVLCGTLRNLAWSYSASRGHSASFVTCPLTWMPDTQVSRCHQRREANRFNKILLFPVWNTNLNISGANKVSLIFFFFPFIYFPAAELCWFWLG